MIVCFSDRFTVREVVKSEIEYSYCGWAMESAKFLKSLSTDAKYCRNFMLIPWLIHISREQFLIVQSLSFPIPPVPTLATSTSPPSSSSFFSSFSSSSSAVLWHHIFNFQSMQLSFFVALHPRVSHVWMLYISLYISWLCPLHFCRHFWWSSFHSPLSAYVLTIFLSVFLCLRVQVAESKVPPFDLGFMYLFKRDDWVTDPLLTHSLTDSPSSRVTYRCMRVLYRRSKTAA